MSKLVTIFGGSGFVGRQIARRMAQEGWRVRVAVRRPNQALFVRPYGAVGQVEPILCNLRDEASVAAAVQGADAVVNCVGLQRRSGKNTFEAVHVEGAARVARLAAANGVTALVQLSVLGAAEGSLSDLLDTKARGDAAVQAAFPQAVILRPSLMFGAGDQSFNWLGMVARFVPLIPVFGADQKLQPVHVLDVAEAAVKAVLGQAEAGIYELGGPEVMTLKQAMALTVDVIERRRVLVSAPACGLWPLATGFDLLQVFSAGLIENRIVTRDAMRLRSIDRIVAAGARGFTDLGIIPTAADQVLPEYLWRFRPAGQYAAIKRSARGLKV